MVDAAQPGWKSRLRQELTSYAYTTLYVYVCLGAIILHKTALLRSEGIDYLPYGIAAIKALIIAKFILLARAIGVGESHRHRPIAEYVGIQVVLYSAVIYALSVIEEIVKALIHGRPITSDVLTVGGSWLLTVADCVLMVLCLTPYLLYTAMADTSGEHHMRRMFFGER
jgi:hypothetical protein